MKQSKKSGSNNVITALLFLIVIGLLAYIIFFNSTGSGRTDFYYDITSLQSQLSYYLGKTHTEMFGAYEIENIITGLNSDGEEIKNIDDTSITSIANKDEVIERNDTKYYKLNDKNIKEILKTDLPTYDGIQWYISQNGELRVSFSGNTPKWWNDNLEKLKIS